MKPALARRVCPWICFALLTPAAPVGAVELEFPTRIPTARKTQADKPLGDEVSLRAGGDHKSLKLGSDVAEVEILKDLSKGKCRIHRTWGYDAEAHELWVSGACDARFRLIRSGAEGATTGPAPADTDSEETAAKKQAEKEQRKKIAIAVGAAAVIGAAILATRDKDRKPEPAPAPAPSPYPPGGYPPGGYPPNGYPGGSYPGNTNAQARPLRLAEGDLCLDLRGGLQPGASAQLGACQGSGYGSNSAPAFQQGAQGELRAGGLCLSAEGDPRRDGGRVSLQRCDGSPAQRWLRQAQEVRNELHGRCLDVEDRRLRAGQSVHLWSCHGDTNQRWW